MNAHKWGKAIKLEGNVIIRQRGGVTWYFEYREKGKPIRKSLKTNDEEVAIEKALKIGWVQIERSTRRAKFLEIYGTPTLIAITADKLGVTGDNWAVFMEIERVHRLVEHSDVLEECPICEVIGTQ